MNIFQLVQRKPFSRHKLLFLISLFFLINVNGQGLDTTRRQFEVSGTFYKLREDLFMQFAMGENFPAKKMNWYNNLAFSVNIQDARYYGTAYHLYSLSVGKSYQHIRNHLFWTAGLNTGPYYAYINRNDGYFIAHYGVSLIPKLEIGYNTKKTVISTGMYFSAGVGTFQSLYNGEKQPNYLKIIGFTNLYLKLILN